MCLPVKNALRRRLSQKVGSLRRAAPAVVAVNAQHYAFKDIQMNKKYEFVDGDTKLFFGVTLRRIRALVAIGSLVASGDLGGYVESEKNLDVSGNAWVYGDARVYGNAWVSGDARVCGNAWVYGDARVYGNAQVCGDKAIFWASKVGRDNETLTVYKGKDGLIVTRGCFSGSTEEFLKKSEKVHDPETHWEYKLLLLVAENRISKG